MLISEMHHQFWITKKTVQRKFGSKEDENIVSSDAELDSKIEVFKSIHETSSDLTKIIDRFQERLCVLSQEECVFGRFLKEVGKRSKSTGQSITNTGKVISYCGQQRMCVRLPLIRLHHEVEVFRSRAVDDTRTTINSMEKERTEYRAALSWMKSISSQLDPDTGKGLGQFRMAQSHVRNAKQNYDKIALDSIQKIDLLAAARCNMFSHALVSYTSELLQFSKKTAATIEAISKALLKNPQYDFSLLKDLSQSEEKHFVSDRVKNIDPDQSLFFMSEYNDDDSDTTEKQNSITSLEDLVPDSTHKETSTLQSSFEISQSDLFWCKSSPKTERSMDIPYANQHHSTNSSASNVKKESSLLNSTKSKLVHPWMDFFANLDPLANPAEFDLKLNSGKINFQQT